MIFRVVSKILYTILLIIETLISIRFIFKLIGADPNNGVVKGIYEISGIFVDPFKGIVSGNWYIGDFYIDVDAIIALIVYMIMAFIVVELIKVFSPPEKKD